MASLERLQELTVPQSQQHWVILFQPALDQLLNNQERIAPNQNNQQLNVIPHSSIYQHAREFMEKKKMRIAPLMQLPNSPLKTHFHFAQEDLFLSNQERIALLQLKLLLNVILHSSTCQHAKVFMERSQVIIALLHLLLDHKQHQQIVQKPLLLP